MQNKLTSLKLIKFSATAIFTKNNHNFHVTMRMNTKSI